MSDPKKEKTKGFFSALSYFFGDIVGGIASFFSKWL